MRGSIIPFLLVLPFAVWAMFWERSRKKAREKELEQQKATLKAGWSQIAEFEILLETYDPNLYAECLDACLGDHEKAKEVYKQKSVALKAEEFDLEIAQSEQLAKKETREAARLWARPEVIAGLCAPFIIIKWLALIFGFVLLPAAFRDHDWKLMVLVITLMTTAVLMHLLLNKLREKLPIALDNLCLRIDRLRDKETDLPSPRQPHADRLNSGLRDDTVKWRSLTINPKEKS